MAGINLKPLITKANGYLLLKIVIAIVCAAFLFRRSANVDFSGFETLFYNSLSTHLWLLVLTVFLIFVNWGLETMKWQYLIIHIEKLSFVKAFAAVMAGVTVSSFTPNRVGEFAGRMLFLKNKLDSRVVALTIVGSMAQLMITLIIGLPGFLYYLTSNDIPGLMFKQWLQGFVLILPFVYVLIFWNVPAIFRILKARFKNNKSLNYISEGASFLNIRGLRYISYLSFFRYMVFLSQYILILLFFNVEMLWWQYLAFIPAIFFIQSVIPTFALTEIGIRVSAAVAVLSFTGLPDDAIIAASSLLWVLNLMFPALIGVFTLLFTKVNGKA